MSRRSLAGLDWLCFFVANAQTGFGPFVAVYLTSQAWTQGEIGAALSLGTVVSMISQIPGGALVDRLRDKRIAALISACGVALAALLFALAPTKPSILLAEVLHSVSSSMLGPAIAAISLALVGRAGLGGRLGRNARFSALGNGVAAAVLGACGTYVSNRAVFWLTCLLMLPGIVALYRIERAAAPPPEPVDPKAPLADHATRREVIALFMDRRLLVFAAAVALFFFANAAMLPLAGSEITRNSGSLANLVIAASIVLPQLIAAAISPSIGKAGDRWGRRPLLLLGFVALPIRGVVLALSANPTLLILVQTLDGLSAAVFGVMLPLVAADITAGTGRFNLCVGVLGLASSGGATLSTLVAGALADDYGSPAAFLALAAAGLAATLTILFAMPETGGAARAPRAPEPAPA
jgi:MFS family permease